MIMKKNLFLAALAIVALASCSSDEYIGEVPKTSNTDGAILFTSETPHITRTSSTDAAKLEYKFKVFGVKTLTSGDQRVFATATTGVAPYDVWFVDNSRNTTESNSSNWEYVGTTTGGPYGTINTDPDPDVDYRVTLSADQTIKYWDYSATSYNFQAWSDINTTENKVSITAIDKNTMTISGTPAKLANLWISDLVTITSSSNTTTTEPNAYGGIVQFTFRKAATKVRLGIYETIPGYVVKDVKFYYNSGSNNSTTNAILDGSFVGSTSTAATYTVSYSGTPQKAVLTPTSDATNTTYFDFGTFTSSSGIGTSSATPTWAGSSTYTDVLPNTSNVGAMTLTADYTLYNATSGETILVSGATASVPSTYMTWNPNYAYTYIFKISDNTNGSTGQSVVGLYPITLDAVIEVADGSQETITTVSTPSITCYQDGVAISSGFDATKDIVVSTSAAATITVKELTGTFDYGKDYENQSYNTTTFESGTSGVLTLGTDVTSATFENAKITASKTYVIKAVATSGGATAYFVLTTGAAETGPNP